jgi:hypothetical protein
VDPDARHGRKTPSGWFDGYECHAVIDPDSELILDPVTGPAQAGDGEMTGRLTAPLEGRDRDPGEHDNTGGDGAHARLQAAYGDAAHGSGEQLADREPRNTDPRVKTKPPARRNGRLSKTDCTIDLDADTGTCPAGATTPIVRAADGSGTARAGRHTVRSGRSVTAVPTLPVAET